MIHRRGMCMVAALGCLLGVGSGVQADRGTAPQDSVEVTVTGQGLSADAARRDALRNALEQGGRIEIASRSHVENFELIRDTIYARADGIITAYRILEEGDAAGGVKYCRIRAKVRKSAVASTWAEVQNVLEQVGRPGVAVFILEKIDGEAQDRSIVESRIERRLLDAGFRVYAGRHLRAIAERESADAASGNDVAKMQRIAKDFGTQIFIYGSAEADTAGVRNLAGEPTAMYNCNALVKVYYTDTAELIASESLTNVRGGARGAYDRSPQAGRKALEQAGQTIVERVCESVMKRWAMRISAGGEIILEVSGLDAVSAIKLRDRIRTINTDKIRRVNYAFTKGTAVYRVQAKLTAEELAEHLTQGDMATLLEIVDIKLNRIQARAVNR